VRLSHGSRKVFRAPAAQLEQLHRPGSERSLLIASLIGLTIGEGVARERANCGESMFFSKYREIARITSHLKLVKSSQRPSLLAENRSLTPQYRAVIL
jgi:hypothetical protein